MLMNEIIMMIVSALGAVAGAAAILAALGIGAVTVTAATAGAVTAAVATLPIAACVGGVAYAASRTGYGGGS